MPPSGAIVVAVAPSAANVASVIGDFDIAMLAPAKSAG